jgi:hypothetical protein
MAETPPCRVCSAELFRNGIIIAFTDGKCALFPADLLYALLSQAQEFTDNDEEEPGS